MASQRELRGASVIKLLAVLLFLCPAMAFPQSELEATRDEANKRLLWCYPEPQKISVPGLWRKGTGEMRARFILRADGTPFNVELASSTYDPKPTEIISATIQSWHFLPALKDSRPVGMRMEVVFDFKPGITTIRFQMLEDKSGCHPSGFRF